MPRKRKATNPLVSKKGTAKRSKSSVPKSRENPSAKQPGDSPEPTEKFYQIRDIIDEKGAKYKVDWEDDPDTGEQFQPSWVAKDWVTPLAIVDWEKRKRKAAQELEEAKASEAAQKSRVPARSRTRSNSPLFVPLRSSSKEPVQVRKHRRTIVESSPSSTTPSETPKGSIHAIPEPVTPLCTSRQVLSHSLAQSSTPDVTDAIAKSSSQIAQPTNLNRPNLTIQISPHNIPSSQVWDFVSYSSAPYSVIQEEGVDSGIGESSPILVTQDVVQTEHEYIVPDSQSLNNSSNHVTNSGKKVQYPRITSEVKYPLPPSSIISNQDKADSSVAPVSRPNRSRATELIEDFSSSLPLPNTRSRSKGGSSNILTRIALGNGDAQSGSNNQDHPVPSQNISSPIQSITCPSRPSKATSPETVAQTVPKSNLASLDPLESPGSLPSTSSLSRKQRNFHDIKLELPAQVAQVAQHSQTNHNTAIAELQPRNLRNSTNGHRQNSSRPGEVKDSEAFNPQKQHSPIVLRYSKPLTRDSLSSLKSRTQDPVSKSPSQAPGLKERGSFPSSGRQNQNTKGLDSPFQSPSYPASPFSNGRQLAPSFYSWNPSNTPSTSKAPSSLSEFQTQVPVDSDDLVTSSRRKKRTSRSRHRSQPADSSAARALLHPSHYTEAFRETEQASELENSSVLGQRDPNSQPERPLHSAQEREEFCIPSIEQELEKYGQSPAPSQSFWRVNSHSPARNMAENGQTAVSPVVQMAPVRPTPTPERSSVPFRERLRNMRAESAARLMANNIEISPPLVQPSVDVSRPVITAAHDIPLPRATHRSPSIIPKPDSVAPVSDSRLDDSRLGIQTIEDPISAGSSQEVPPPLAAATQVQLQMQLSQQDIAQALKSPKIGDMEFVVPLPAPARVRDQYVAIINSYQKVIHAIVAEEDTDPETIEKGQEFLDNIENLSIHLDMVDSTTSTQQDVPPQAEALWASNCSFKFQFLQYMIRYMRTDDVHIVIVAKEGRLIDLIETFLKGWSASYNRPDTMSSRPGLPQDNLRISLITSKEGESTELLPAAHLVIAFDSSFNAAHGQVQEVRSHLLNVGQLAPVVHLMIYSSPEHISRCLPSSITDLERLRIMISCVTFTREEFGSILPEENIPEANAEEVAVFVKAGAGSPWMIPSIRPVEIQGLDINFQTSQKSTQHSEDEPAPAKAKRALEIEDEGRATPKRMRMTPVPDHPDVTHVSDSAPGTSAPSDSQVIQELRATIDQHKAREKDYKAREEQSKLREAKLQAGLATSEARAQEVVADLSALQMRYEKRNVQYHTLKHENKELLAKSIIFDQAQRKAKLDLESSKEKNTILETSLANSRAALQNSSVPSLAALEAAESSARDAIALSDSVQKELDSLQSSFEYTRQQYQVASTSAAESANRISELEAANAELKRKAAGEAARLKEVNNRAEAEVHKKRIAELETTLEEREDLLKRKEGARGRGVQTRAGSVQPRSPRLGAVSRQGSPLPGFLGVGRGRGRFQG